MKNNTLKYKAQKRLESMCAFGTSKYALKEQAKREARENNISDYIPIYNEKIRYFHTLHTRRIKTGRPLF